MSPKKQHTVIAGDRTVATAAFYILAGWAPGFANPRESTRNFPVNPQKGDPSERLICNTRVGPEQVSALARIARRPGDS
jgi:hypothetical protein